MNSSCRVLLGKYGLKLLVLGLLIFLQTPAHPQTHMDGPVPPFRVQRGETYEEIAQNLFACLRKCDQLGLDLIFTEAFDETGIGAAIMNRMTKAAEGRIVYAT